VCAETGAGLHRNAVDPGGFGLALQFESGASTVGGLALSGGKETARSLIGSGVGFTQVAGKFTVHKGKDAHPIGAAEVAAGNAFHAEMLVAAGDLIKFPQAGRVETSGIVSA